MYVCKRVYMQGGMDGWNYKRSPFDARLRLSDDQPSTRTFTTAQLHEFQFAYHCTDLSWYKTAICQLDNRSGFRDFTRGLHQPSRIMQPTNIKNITRFTNR